MTKPQTTREKIDAAAIRLMAARGIDQVSMREIAQAVGVTEAALYRHTTGKDALVWDIFTRYYDAFAARLAARQAVAMDLKQKIAVMVGECATLFDSQRDVFVFLLLAQHIRRLAPADYEAALPQLLKQLFAQAMRARHIPKQNVDILTAMVMGIVLQTASSLLYGAKQPAFAKASADRPALMVPHVKILTNACWRIIAGETP